MKTRHVGCHRRTGTFGPTKAFQWPCSIMRAGGATRRSLHCKPAEGHIALSTLAKASRV